MPPCLSVGSPMILVVGQAVERCCAIALLPSCLPQALPSEGSMDIRIRRSKRCVPGTRHHLQIVPVNPGNPISFNVQSHIQKSSMSSQPHPIYALQVPMFECSGTSCWCAQRCRPQLEEARIIYRSQQSLDVRLQSYTYDFPTTLAGIGVGGCLTAKKGA